MKSGMLIPLLLVSLVIHEAQGMGLIRKESLPFSHQFMSHKITLQKTNEDVVEEVNMGWKSKFSGRARKLMITFPIPTTTTISKNEKEKKKEENLSVNSSSKTDQRQPTAAETYPDILDIAGMDYSQARRKPPIHN